MYNVCNVYALSEYQNITARELIFVALLTENSDSESESGQDEEPETDMQMGEAEQPHEEQLDPNLWNEGLSRLSYLFTITINCPKT